MNNSNNNRIEKNGIITLKYNMYDKNGNWITKGGPITMVVGDDTILPGLSEALLGLDYTIKNQTINFKFFKNKNNYDFEWVDLDLEIYSYNDFENIEGNDKQEFNDGVSDGNDQFQTPFMKNNKIEKNNKKEIHNFKKEINDLKAKIEDLDKNEILLNKKIVEISQNAQKHIDEFKMSYKQQHNEKLKEAKDFQLQSFFEKFLGPFNNLYMAIEFGVKSSENPELVGYVKGFELLINQMFNILNSVGISPIEPKVGDEFDPSLHNIIKLVKTDELQKDKIVELLNRGYKLNGRVIMPANVLVSTK